MIKNSKFIDNMVGIAITKVDYPVIANNEFTIGKFEISEYLGSDFQSCALKTIFSTGYQIEDNNVVLSNSPSADCKTFGFIIQSSGKYNNELYNNSFTDIQYAINSVDLNRDINLSYSGLQFLCNNFIDIKENDIDVYFSDNQSLRGVREFQGNGICAGNNFSNYILEPQGNIENNSNYYINYLFSGSSVQSNSFYPWNVSLANVNRINSYPNNCPSHIENALNFPLGISKRAETEINYSTSEVSYYNLLYNYYQQIDDGSTPTILLEIQNNWSQEAWELRNQLMAMSPFVSQKVIEEAALTGILPDALLLEICLANPDATRRYEFLDLLQYDIPNTLPQYMIDLIIQNWDAVTPRTILEKSIAKYGSEREFYSNCLIKDKMHMDEYSIIDKRILHENRDELMDRYHLAQIYLESFKFDSAEFILDGISLDFELNDIEDEELMDFYSILNLHKDLSTSGRSVYDLTQNEISNLLAISETSNQISAGKARSILCFAFDLCEDYYGYNDVNSNKSTSPNEIKHFSLMKEIIEVTLTPNPAVDYICVEWNMFVDDGIARANVYDSKGNIVRNSFIKDTNGSIVIDLKDLASGIYTFEIIYSKEQIYNSKFVITQ